MNRDEILREMGIAPIWKLRTNVADADARPIPIISAAAPEPVPALADSPEGDAADRPPATISDLQPTATFDPRPTPNFDPQPVSSPVATMDWDALEQTIAGCRKCGLCRQRKQAVPGVGDRRADWLFVGEGPGAEEDERGEPFVGQAGRLLDSMLSAIGLRRGERVYIANAVKCRPPGNRTPTPEEMAACRPYLERQIALIQPKLIVVLGKAAAHTILGNDGSLSGMRGQRFAHAGVPVVVTYHPAYLLRNLPDKAKAWQDLCFARRTLAELSDDGMR